MDFFSCAVLSDIIVGVDELACVADWSFAENNRHVHKSMSKTLNVPQGSE